MSDRRCKKSEIDFYAPWPSDRELDGRVEKNGNAIWRGEWMAGLLRDCRKRSGGLAGVLDDRHGDVLGGLLFAIL
jgi:hypothetical protein